MSSKASPVDGICLQPARKEIWAPGTSVLQYGRVDGEAPTRPAGHNACAFFVPHQGLLIERVKPIDIFMIARVGHARHEREAHLRKDMGRHRDIECLADGCGFHELCRSAHPLQVRHQNICSFELQQLKDALVVISVLTGGNRDIDSGGNLGF
jgi:hypothetical protein